MWSYNTTSAGSQSPGLCFHIYMHDTGGAQGVSGNPVGLWKAGALCFVQLLHVWLTVCLLHIVFVVIEMQCSTNMQCAEFMFDAQE
jgi:hypothetical protein